jgi:predicted HAD superfamily Cof-like phosphohydrolase
VWQPADVLKRRVPRVLVTAFLLVVAVGGLSGCRTSPNVAAYVGQEQITVAALNSAIDQRLADEDIAAYAKGHEDEFTRRVLSLLVQNRIYAAAAEKYHVQVGDGAVQARITQLLGTDDPDTVYGSLAQQGIGREDVFENVRQQLLRQRIAEAEGKADALDVTALKARYDQVRESLKQISFGYITVPDDATAATVVAQLTADPASYPAVAAAHPDQNTLTTLQSRTADKLPGVLAKGITAAKPNSAFSTPVPEIGGVVVTFVAGPVYPSFEEVRPDLEKEAGDTVDKAGAALVDDVRKDLGVRVNPRFGAIEGGKLVAGSGGVVDILKDDAAKAAAASSAAPTPGN